MGADSFKVFMTVALPLIKDSFLSGLVTAFVRSITAISAIILLVTPQFLLITVQINEFAEKGAYSIACAFATILILCLDEALGPEFPLDHQVGNNHGQQGGDGGGDEGEHISALRQIDKSIEESAYDMGADSFKVFMTVTLPLIKDSFLSGLGMRESTKESRKAWRP